MRQIHFTIFITNVNLHVAGGAGAPRALVPGPDSDCCSAAAAESQYQSVFSESQTSTWANTMADTKTANISRLVIKQAGRAKEKVINIMIHTHVSLQLVSQ